LFAANLSTSFRLRKFGMVRARGGPPVQPDAIETLTGKRFVGRTAPSLDLLLSFLPFRPPLQADLSMYGVQMRLEELHRAPVLADSAPNGADGASPVEDAISEGSVRSLLPHMKKLPIKRIVHLSNVTASPIRVSLSYNTSTHHGLPPGVDMPELASFEITGIEGVIERYNVSGVVGLRFEADYGGVMRFDKAEAVVEYEVMEEKIVTVKVTDGEGAGDARTHLGLSQQCIERWCAVTSVNNTGLH